jgi:L-alanine-DL-glutamate epimerase-like enolase superfamily enzyme
VKITDVTLTLFAWDNIPATTYGRHTGKFGGQSQLGLLTLRTDEGAEGHAFLGSASRGANYDAESLIAALKPLVMDQDPLDRERLYQALLSRSRQTTWRAIGAVDVALWDLAGKVTGQPVSILFGGATDALPAYASTGERRAPDERAASAVAIADAGFRAMKLRIDRTRIDQGLETVRAVRDAVGDRLELTVDLNAGWRMAGDTTPSLDVAAARRTADALAELGVLWLEEPLDGADLRGHVALRAGARIRIAGGEMTRTMAELLAALDADALDVYQPDAVIAVGMLRARTIGELALARNRWFTPHTWTNGLGLLANLHVAAGVGGGPFIEFPYDPPGWTTDRRDAFLAEPIRPDADGLLHVPAAPGLGAVLDEAAIKRYAA